MMLAVNLFRKLTWVKTIVNNIPLLEPRMLATLNSMKRFFRLLIVNRVMNNIKIITTGGIMVVIIASLKVAPIKILKVYAGKSTVSYELILLSIRDESLW